MNNPPVLIRYDEKTNTDLMVLYQDTNDRILKALYDVSHGKGIVRSGSLQRKNNNHLSQVHMLRLGSFQCVEVTLNLTTDCLVVEVHPRVPILRTLMYTLTFGLASTLALLLHPGLKSALYTGGEAISYTVTMGVVIGLMILTSITLFIPDFVGTLFHHILPSVWQNTQTLAENARNEVHTMLPRENPHLTTSPDS